MKREYLIFGGILLVLLVAYAITRNWIGSEQEKAETVKEARTGRLQTEKLTKDWETRFAELEKMVDQRLDSLERAYRDSAATAVPVADTVVESATDTLQQAHERSYFMGESLTVIDTFVNPPDTVIVHLGEKRDTVEAEVVSDAPSEVEVRIYNQYLKRRWGLPGDLTKYELSVAKAEIYNQLAAAYGISETEARAVVDKVYEYRKRGKE